ncbi:hypothetical protein BJ322DRAFT_1017054 [Thelephora terrestris]|uniref:Uncharacterized protein n=1 Tax=Thelephora terrestris TaxID=56493 RepID=A0A9P6LAX7_9AGAM|nr:hypothetical protein BJ322DRAFT_1017054 [Thelephora terrestris]
MFTLSLSTCPWVLHERTLNKWPRSMLEVLCPGGTMSACGSASPTGIGVCTSSCGGWGGVWLARGHSGFKDILEDRCHEDVPCGESFLSGSYVLLPYQLKALDSDRGMEVAQGLCDQVVQGWWDVVVMLGKELFNLHGPLGSMSPPSRRVLITMFSMIDSVPWFVSSRKMKPLRVVMNIVGFGSKGMKRMFLGLLLGDAFDESAGVDIFLSIGFWDGNRNYGVFVEV